MLSEKTVYKNANRIDQDGLTIWKNKLCKVSKCCCCYAAYSTFTKDQYNFCCPKFKGVDEKGILCSIPNSIDFILSDY